MTDLEITRLCAEAMGLEVIPRNISPDGKGGLQIHQTEHGPIKWYRPLHDDAQCMALVKKFGLAILNDDDDSWWVGLALDSPDTEYAEASDLNRAICECVAKMQAAK